MKVGIPSVQAMKIATNATPSVLDLGFQICRPSGPVKCKVTLIC